MSMVGAFVDVLLSLEDPQENIVSASSKLQDPQQDIVSASSKLQDPQQDIVNASNKLQYLQLDIVNASNKLRDPQADTWSSPFYDTVFFWSDWSHVVEIEACCSEHSYNDGGKQLYTLRG
ncbi:hypothetical protein FHG87_008231 [Trinorchestia longiramus]|nr:hypothetical protein FHG87_008231 [Trinorchestia longiramus]